MKCLIIVVALFQIVHSGHVNVQLPYLNPAGVTYVGSHSALAPAAYTGLTAGPYTTSTFYGNSKLAGRLATGTQLVNAHASPYIATPAHLLPVPAAAFVPTVHQVPAVADVPITRIEAQPGYIHKELDVPKQAVKTSRYELRRPAIQKEFYDIEERVIVRPAGSALVELEQPHSKIQKSSLVSPALPAHFAPTHFAPAHFNPAVITGPPIPPTFVSPVPPQNFDSTPRPINDGGFVSDDESVVVEARNRPQEPHQPQELRPRIQQRQQSLQQSIPIHSPALPAQPIFRAQTEARYTPEDPTGNQQRLIDLLTSRNGIADVGFGGPAFRDIGDAGTVRARVLQAEYAPRNLPPTGERFNTRRVVVSRPIETIEEVDVVEPFTKLERVTVQHPALFKTAHVGIARVPTSVPVLGKTIAHTPIYYH